MSARGEHLKKLQAVDFAIIETALYLDTHPTDKAALAYYKKLIDERRDIREEFTKMHGPLTCFENTDSTDWAWMKGPWPWETEAN